MQDIGGFAHFHHESRTAGRQIIRRANAGKDAIYRADDRPFRRDKTAQMRQQHNQCGLAHVSGFAAEIRAGHDQHPPLFRFKLQIIGHKRLVQHLFHHRVTTGLNRNARFSDQFRRIPAQRGGAFGQIAQDIQFRQYGGAGLKRGQAGNQLVEQRVIENFFPR